MGISRKVPFSDAWSEVIQDTYWLVCKSNRLLSSILEIFITSSMSKCTIYSWCSCRWVKRSVEFTCMIFNWSKSVCSINEGNLWCAARCSAFPLPCFSSDLIGIHRQLYKLFKQNVVTWLCGFCPKLRLFFLTYPKKKTKISIIFVLLNYSLQEIMVFSGPSSVGDFSKGF